MSECNCTTPECTCGGTGSVIVKIDHDPVVKILKKRISDLEAANAKQATRIAELEDENQQLNEDLTIAYMAGIEKGKDEYRGRVQELEDEREKLEPVGFMDEKDLAHLVKGNPRWVEPFSEDGWQPLYARPVPARTLTDDKIFELDAQHLWIESDVVCGRVGFARAIEAWLKGGE